MIFFFLITKITGDYGGEFDSVHLKYFVKIMVFLMTSRSQGLLNKNGVVEKNHRTLQEFVRSM